METFLVLNGWELDVGIDEQEAVILALAAGTMERVALTDWVRSHIRQRQSQSGSATGSQTE
jgi:death-on-curing protein